MDIPIDYDLVVFITLFFVAGVYLCWRLGTSLSSKGTVLGIGTMFLTIFASMLLYLCILFFFEITIEPWHVLIGVILFVICYVLIEYDAIRSGLKRLFLGRN